MNSKIGERHVIHTAVGPRVCYVRQGNPALPAIIILAGYCQTVVLIAIWLMQHLFGKTQHTVIAVQRMGIETERPTDFGRWGFTEQLADLIAIFTTLRTNGFVGKDQEVLWIGHSLGAHLAAKMCELYSRSRLLLWAPIPLIPFALLFNLCIWFGGLVALPSVAWSWITGKGGACPDWTKRWLFAGHRATREEFKAYTATLQLDAGAIFFQVLLGYGWLYRPNLKLLRKLIKGGKVVMVSCRYDWIMPCWATRLTAWWLGCPLLWLNTGHCSVVHDPDPEASAQTMRAAVDLLLPPQ